MKIYQIDCSARKEGSTSRMLAKKILEKVKKEKDAYEKKISKMELTIEQLSNDLKLKINVKCLIL